MPNDWLTRKLYALLGAAGVKDREDRLRIFRWVLCEDSINSTDDLSPIQMRAIVDVLDHWQRHGELACRAREITCGG